MLSKTKSYADIDPAIKEKVISRFGGKMARNADGTYRFVAYIELNGAYNFRSSFGQGDYGSFCDEDLAAFVSNYGRMFPVLTREQVWEDLGIVNLDELPEECFAQPP